MERVDDKVLEIRTEKIKKMANATPGSRQEAQMEVLGGTSGSPKKQNSIEIMKKFHKINSMAKNQKVESHRI